MAVSAVSDWFGVFREATGVESQITLSVGVILLAVLVGRLVAPATVRWTKSTFDWAMERQGFREGIETIRQYTPWWASMRTVIHLLQLAVVGSTILALLAIWGQTGLVRSIYEVAPVSIGAVGRLGMTFLFFFLAYVAIEALHGWLASITDRSEHFSRHQEEVAFRVLQLTVLTGVLLLVLTLWEVDLGGLLIGAGFVGIVAGLAAQQTLGSLIAGFVLMFSRPFEIGDWVEIGDNEGIITEITIVNTRLENFDGEYVVLPNDKVGNETIINRSQKGRLRIRVEVGIDYDADPEHAQEVAIAALKEVDEILRVPRPQAITNRMGDSAVILELRFWIDKPSARRRARATSATIRAVKRAFEEAGIKIPFPQRELSDRVEEGGFQVVNPGPEAEE